MDGDYHSRLTTLRAPLVISLNSPPILDFRSLVKKINSTRPSKWAPKLSALLNLRSNPLEMGGPFPPPKLQLSWVPRLFIYFFFSFSLSPPLSLSLLSFLFLLPFLSVHRTQPTPAAARPAMTAANRRLRLDTSAAAYRLSPLRCLPSCEPRPPLLEIHRCTRPPCPLRPRLACSPPCAPAVPRPAAVPSRSRLALYRSTDFTAKLLAEHDATSHLFFPAFDDGMSSPPSGRPCQDPAPPVPATLATPPSSPSWPVGASPPPCS